MVRSRILKAGGMGSFDPISPLVITNEVNFYENQGNGGYKTAPSE